LLEFFTPFGGGSAAPARLSIAAWVRLLVVLPLVMAPAWWTWRSFGDALYGSDELRHAWEAQLMTFVAANAAILVIGRRGERHAGLLRAMTYASLCCEIGSGVLTSHLLGTLTSTAIGLAVLVVAAYRIFFDYRLGLAAALLGAGSFVVAGWLELSGRWTLTAAVEGHVVYQHPELAASVLHAGAATIVLAFFLVNYSVNQTLKLHRYITEVVLRRYLPPDLVKRAAVGELRLDAEPERRTVTVMFTDLVGFTELSEELGADQVGRVLNGYLSLLATLAHEAGGTVDKFVGDAVMVVFGAPEQLPAAEQALRAVTLAERIHRAVATLDAPAPLRARTGINTGDVVVGNFGSEVRSDYTVIGPAVNLAARLESASQPGRTLVGAATAELLGDFPLEDAGELHLKGIAQPVRAYFVAIPADTA
jgi:class 3 adenylate cyclase